MSCAFNRAGEDRREERYKQCVGQEISLRADLSAVNVDQISAGGKCIERYAKRQDRIERMKFFPRGGEERSEREIQIFRSVQDAEMKKE